MKSRIYKGLYIGNKEEVEKNGNMYDVIINVTTDVPFYSRNDDKTVTHVRIPALDSSIESQQLLFFQSLPYVCNLIDECLRNDKTVLVHCNEGKQRSASLILAYMMRKERKTFEEAKAALLKMHGIAFDTGKVHYQKALQVWEYELKKVWDP